VAKRSKKEKRKRAEGVIAGLRKHFGASRRLRVLGKAYTPDELIALFEEHVRALRDVDDLTLRRSLAIEKERAIEARLAPVLRSVKSLVVSAFDASAPELREFGFEPDKKPHMTAETKRTANEKRQATRKERGTTGRKGRRQAKATE
jgi:hypothetical protein